MHGSPFNQYKIVASVQTGLRNFFWDSYKENLHTLEVGAIKQRAFSTVTFFTAKTNHRNCRLVAKTTVHHPLNRSITETDNQAVIEYSILNRLYPHFQNVRSCSVPRPLIVFPGD